VANKAPLPSANEPATLSDADIDSRRSVSRRSLLGALGLGAGVAATIIFAAADSVPAADSDSKKKKAPKKPPPKKKKPKEETDND
jgi:hypothetical protein